MDRVKNLFDKLVKASITLVEQVVASLVAAFFTLVANPSPIFTALELFIVGMIWLLLGDFLISHTHILRFILQVLQDFSKIASVVFTDALHVIEKALNVVGSVGNAAGGVINDITGSNTVPHIPAIPMIGFPYINYEPFIEDLDKIGNSTSVCNLFDSPFYTIAYPLRNVLNGHICPIVRYTFKSLLYTPFAWLMSPFYFNADPTNFDSGNCEDNGAWAVCFWLKFGNVLAYILAPLVLIFYLFTPFKTMLLDILALVGTFLHLLATLALDSLHLMFKRKLKAENPTKNR